MKKAAAILMTLALSMSLSSCKGKKEENKPEPKSAKEIMETYTKTLTSAPKRARSAEEAAEKRNELEEKALKEVDQ